MSARSSLLERKKERGERAGGRERGRDGETEPGEGERGRGRKTEAVEWREQGSKIPCVRAQVHVFGVVDSEGAAGTAVCHVVSLRSVTCHNRTWLSGAGLLACCHKEAFEILTIFHVVPV